MSSEGHHQQSAQRGVKTTRLWTSTALPPSPRAGVYKAHKNLKSLPRVRGIYFKETPARKRILQICRLKATFSAAPAYCTSHSSLGPAGQVTSRPKGQADKSTWRFSCRKARNLGLPLPSTSYIPNAAAGQARPSSTQHCSSAPFSNLTPQSKPQSWHDEGRAPPYQIHRRSFTLP